MDQLIEFVITVVLISASGVMAPGPLFVATISRGLRGGGKEGIQMAVGHAIVELPLIVLLGIGVFSFEIFPEFRPTISILGAIVLFAFAGIQIKTILQKKNVKQIEIKNSAIISGVLLSALNPFFIIWWVSVGFKLISDAMLIWAFAGIIIVFLMHIWMDFAWMYSIAHLASKSLKILSNRNYKIMMCGLSLLLIYFGISFIVDMI